MTFNFQSDNSRDIYRHMLEMHGSYGVDYENLNMGITYFKRGIAARKRFRLNFLDLKKF